MTVPTSPDGATLKKVPLDSATWRRVTSALEVARRQGLDPAEELHRQGLILAPLVRLETERHVMSRLIGLLLLWRPDEMLRRRFDPSHSSTPAEMYQCVIDFVREFQLKLEEVDGSN